MRSRPRWRTPTTRDDPQAAAASSAAASDVARAGALAYAEAIAAFAAGAPRARVDDPTANFELEYLYEKEAKDLAARQELADDTVLEGVVRRLRRGVLSPDEPTQGLFDLPDDALAALPDVLARYRETLIDPPELPFFTLIDAARE
ncbi:MAG TPA: hypothetical protein VHB21_12430, partial [Minicystis sp.]|nr:hypothetical protein [Minicystis sp.]